MKTDKAIDFECWFIILGFLFFVIVLQPTKGACADDIIIMTFGDSITCGYPVIPYSGWDANGCNCGPTQKKLEDLLDQSGRASLVLNWGHGGESTVHGLKRITSDMNTTISILGKLDYVLLLEGTNDYSWGLSPATTAYNIGRMIDKIKAVGAVPLVGTLTPDTKTNGKNIPKYNSAVISTVNAKEAILVDHYSRIVHDWSSLTYDGLHPNQEGYEFMGNVWFGALLSQINGKNIAPILNLLLENE